jgi:F-type H+-transporting ATPase subunit c
MEPEVIKYISAGLAIAIGAAMPAWAQGTMASKALEGMARNPEVANKLFTNTIIFLAFAESLAIYCLIVSLILLFAA